MNESQQKNFQQLQMLEQKSSEKQLQKRDSLYSSEPKKKINFLIQGNQNNDLQSNNRDTASVKQSKDFIIESKNKRNSGLKFFKIEKPHSNQVQKNEATQSQAIYQISRQLKNPIVRTNSLMKDFCYFQDADNEEGVKLMYDESLVEWKKFQNSRINEPTRLKRKSNQAPQQNIFLSLGKKKRISIKEIQKVKDEQQQQQLQAQQQEENQKIIPMAMRRKSCECLYCGRLNSKQLQLQDLPFIPKQHKKQYDIIYRTSLILAVPLRKLQKPSPPDSPKKVSKSQTNITSANGQRKSFQYTEKVEKIQQKSKLGQAQNKIDIQINLSPNTSIERIEDNNLDNKQSFRNLKWEDRVSETSIEENPTNQKLRHKTVLVRKNSKFEPSHSPQGSQKKIKVEGVLEKSVKEKSKCMKAMMNFLKKIIDKVQKEELQKINKDLENNEQKSDRNKDKALNIENQLMVKSENSNNIQGQDSQDILNNQETDIQDSQYNKKNSLLNTQNTLPREFQRKKSSVGDLFKPRNMKVSSNSHTDIIQIYQRSEKEVIQQMETLSQFRDRYLKQFSISKVYNNKKSKKNKSVNERNLETKSSQTKRDFQLGNHASGKDEQRKKMDSLIDQLMVFSENHTPLLQSPYYAEIKSEEQIFDKQYNKKNFYQKVFTQNLILEDNHYFNPSQTTRSFYAVNNNNNNNVNSNFTLLNVPTVNTFTVLNQSSSPLPSKPQTSSSNKKKHIIFAQSIQENKSGALNGFKYSSGKRTLSSSDLLQQNKSAKFNSYLQPLSSQKLFSSSNFLSPPLQNNYQLNGNTQQPQQQQNSKKIAIGMNGRKSYNILNQHSPKKPYQVSTARFASFQSTFFPKKSEINSTNALDNHTTIKSFKELDLLLEAPTVSQQASSKQNSLNSTLYKKGSKPQAKIAAITQQGKDIHQNFSYKVNQSHSQPTSSQENTIVIQNEPVLKNSSIAKENQVLSLNNINNIENSSQAVAE
ncbi:hypothetical protein TTHERM_00452010 (macronuclear) [Tetrahymena thermophila SB210]|uniref:Uncharacterized protein n=1 Tax=Tetrahymena thermophila (strain SB210) TaxID=312017 RepID=Q238R7_TETTS|nr:hypothetical protein TTHERM_00452010 [Tetrahymena thermophila SB210]EAR93153.2 hypothetical protein TTHERM_00452010 [Tetrahymena thermophila SB210]|eukprot:XP_001013398.2 hypothetical protein TTHERM_00452010 [Tetrahymena thermophila SB210]